MQSILTNWAGSCRLSFSLKPSVNCLSSKLDFFAQFKPLIHKPRSQTLSLPVTKQNETTTKLSDMRRESERKREKRLWGGETNPVANWPESGCLRGYPEGTSQSSRQGGVLSLLLRPERRESTLGHLSR